MALKNKMKFDLLVDPDDPTVLILQPVGQELENGNKYTINIKDLDYLIMPSNCLGSVPVFECIKRNIPVYAIEENQTILDITKQKIFPKADGIISVNSYWELLEKIAL